MRDENGEAPKRKRITTKLLYSVRSGNTNNSNRWHSLNKTEDMSERYALFVVFV